MVWLSAAHQRRETLQCQKHHIALIITLYTKLYSIYGARGSWPNFLHCFTEMARAQPLTDLPYHVGVHENHVHACPCSSFATQQSLRGKLHIIIVFAIDSIRANRSHFNYHACSYYE